MLFIGNNEEPSFSDTTNGFKRRAYVINFHHINNFDNYIDMAQVKQERGKFVYTCLYYAKKAMNKHELTQTTSIIQTRKKWLTDNDLVQQFIDEKYVLIKNATTDQNALYQKYRDWCTDNGVNPLSNTKLKNELERKGITRKSKNIRNSNQSRQRIYYYMGLIPKSN